jgi:AcrR family transcriptional regulator
MERRQALIDAAWRCAATKRFGDLTVDDVCTAAGVSKGAFYGYFDSKQDLLLALLDQDAADLDRLLDELDAADLDPIERLRRVTRAMLELGDQPARVQVRADLWADILTDAEVRTRFSATIQRRRVTLRRWIEEGIAAGEVVDVPTNATASILLALSDGLLLHASLDAAAFRWSNIRRALEVLLAALAPPAPPPAGGSARRPSVSGQAE